MFHIPREEFQVVKQTLLQLQEITRRAERTGIPARNDDYAGAILARMPVEDEARRRYLGEIGGFIATAMDGWVGGPEDY